MDQVMVYDKSFQERFEEYSNILNDCKVSDLRKNWSSYLDLTLDTAGWQAVWKMPRTTCSLFEIPFPTFVLVYVENIDCTEQMGYVQILAVQDDDIHLPDHHYVPLVELWPTKLQDKSVAINIDTTANALDTLRFFYLNLYMPWDEENDCVWIDTHLESRLRLFYDAKNATLAPEIVERLKSLVPEVKRLEIKRDKLREELEDYEDELALNYNNLDDENIYKFVEAQVEMKELQNEFEFLENPLLRMIYKKQHNIDTEFRQWIVFHKYAASECVDFIKRVQNCVGNGTLSASSTLSEVLNKMNPNDCIFLSKSRHEIKYIGILERGGIITGLYENSDTVIAGTNENVIFFVRGNVTLENLTIDASKSHCAILVHSGKLHIKNCKVVSNGNSQHAIIALGKSVLQITDSEINNFAFGIVGNSYSNITVEGSNIVGCGTGLKIHDNCKINVKDTEIVHSKKYGVLVETEDTAQVTSEIGDFSCLERFDNIFLQNIKGEGNAKGNARVFSKKDLVPFLELFNGSMLRDFKNTSQGDSSLDMSFENEDTKNDTVIEKN